jgi:lipoyl(octanoyl) transferase
VKINIINLGRIDYLKALKFQELLLEKRQNNEIEDTLILVEHNPVITIGKRGNDANITMSKDYLEKNGINVYEVSRGGDVTYHGPGQIVGYPIIDIKSRGKGIKDFVLLVEEVFIRLLNDEFNIRAEREEGKYTGIWIGSSKITAIGIAIKKWVSMHGFAFNINTNLDHFKWIVPCGITDREVTSLDKLTGNHNDFEHLKKMTAEYFIKVFNYEEYNEVYMTEEELEWQIKNLNGLK